jgi:hypothetical protein
MKKVKAMKLIEKYISKNKQIKAEISKKRAEAMREVFIRDGLKMLNLE